MMSPLPFPENHLGSPSSSRASVELLHVGAGAYRRHVRWLTIRGLRGFQVRCGVPVRLPERVRGLLRREAIEMDEALLIPDATCVHTFGMRFPILVARLDDSLRVVDARRVMPYRLVMPMRNARHVLECHPNVDLRAGDALRVDDDLRIGSVRRSRRRLGNAPTSRAGSIEPRSKGPGIGSGYTAQAAPGPGAGRARRARAPIV